MGSRISRLRVRKMAVPRTLKFGAAADPSPIETPLPARCILSASARTTASLVVASACVETRLGFSITVLTPFVTCWIPPRRSIALSTALAIWSLCMLTMLTTGFGPDLAPASRADGGAFRGPAYDGALCGRLRLRGNEIGRQHRD